MNSSSTVPLVAVLTTSELCRRPHRAPDFETESHALGELADALATAPQAILQKLAEVALRLCNAHSAGISLLEQDAGVPVFRWRALAGAFEPHLGSTLPRAFSPCGTVVDCDSIQLMSQPARHFPYISAMVPEIEEAMLIPFHLHGIAIGTIWVVAHDQTRHFDAEDARLIASLGKFAAAASEVLASIRALEVSAAAQSRATASAEAAGRDKDRFMAILAHELRSPLGPLLNAAALLKNETLDSGVIRRTSDMIVRQVGSMTRLVDDMMDLSRVRLGGLELRRTSIAVSEIVARAVEATRAAMALHGHTFEVTLPPEPLMIDVDATRVIQVIQNLVNNAVKYTNAGGVVRIDVRRESEDVVFRVADNGIGIESGQLERVFDLYAQAGQKETTRSEGGLGIGLYLVRLLVELHGGSVRAASAGAGRGSEFTVRLPSPVMRESDAVTTDPSLS